MRKFIIHTFCLFLLLGISTNLFSQSKYKSVREGNRFYDEGSFIEAEIQYKKSLEKDSTYSKAAYNLGNVLYRQKRYDEALQYYEKVVDSDDKKIWEDAMYNLGNACFRKGIDDLWKGIKSDAMEKARESYINVLKENPNHQDAKQNLSYWIMFMEKMEQANNKDKSNQKQNKEPEEDPEALAIKKQAEDLVSQKRYKEAYDLMKNSAKKNANIQNYNDFTNRISEIIKMN